MRLKMIPAPLNQLSADLSAAIQEGALAAATMVSHSGIELEFVLAAFYFRRPQELTNYFEDNLEFRGMCQKFLVLPENRDLPKPTSEDSRFPVPSNNSAPGWSIEFSSELLRILSSAGRIAAAHKRSLASIEDLVDALAQDTPAISRIQSKWGITLKAPGGRP
jgi:hypothetical protein